MPKDMPRISFVRQALSGEADLLQGNADFLFSYRRLFFDKNLVIGASAARV